MRGKSMSRRERQERLGIYLKHNPFATDEELAQRFKVSIPTIRLDRSALGIPELRQRVKHVAEEAYTEIRSMHETELVGELVDIELNNRAISIMEVTEEMVLEKTKILRGHHLFAQANSLAAAIIDANVVLTGSCRLRFLKPVSLNDKVIAKAIVKVKKTNSALVSVYSRVDKEMVFRAQLILLMQC
ncbi:transcription factor FapR [Metallumcola ferriviriculae]|uniref:Transcription factor FapR n=1 Tax=Metallumcola ferriviriculae TaxID=3039180 RepID=A0AAU0UM48_9FIRM|nr:transcription factor FapR [Desulfitibacteraceae bacterium MK1]